MEYNESKKMGNVGENEILKRIHKQYPQAYIDNTGEANSDWDIYIPEIQVGIEVKMDYESLESGNLLIEVIMNGKFSALSKTKAKYWVFITGERYIWITPLEIYRFIEQHFEYGRVPITGNGDSKEKLAYLPKVKVFLKHVYSLDKEYGWVEMMKEDDILHHKLFLNKL